MMTDERNESCFPPTKGNILHLSDEVLLMILKHLSSEDLINLYRSCGRFRRICHEAELWRKIETPDDYDAVSMIFDSFLGPQTVSLKIESKVHGGNSAYKSSISYTHLAHLFPSLRTNPAEIGLTHLYLIRQRLDKRILSLSDLPATLKVLHLTGTVLSNVSENSFYFKDVWKALPNLEDINLTDCTWVTAHSLMGLSKFTSLEKLSLRGCRDIGNCLAYASLAFRFGFKALKVLDVTNTQFGTGEFDAVALLSNLEEFYCGEYDNHESTNPIQDFSLHSLRGLSNLRVIDISGHDITDSGLNTLLHVPSLNRIDAHFTSISSGAIKRFMQLRVDCVVNKSSLYAEY